MIKAVNFLKGMLYGLIGGGVPLAVLYIIAKLT